MDGHGRAGILPGIRRDPGLAPTPHSSCSIHEEEIGSTHQRVVGVDVLVGRDDRRIDPDHAGEIRRGEPAHELAPPRREVDALEAAGDFRQAIDEEAAAVGRPAGDEVVGREGRDRLTLAPFRWVEPVLVLVSLDENELAVRGDEPDAVSLRRQGPRLAVDLLDVAARRALLVGAADEDPLSVGKPRRRAVLRMSPLSRRRGSPGPVG